MDSGTADCGALSESIVFLAYFKDLSDPRQQGKVIYPLNEVLLLCLVAVLAGAETFTDIALFGEKKLDLLRRFLPFRNGAPAHDRLGEIFAVLDAEVFQRCFVSWVTAMTGVPAVVIAIDGKTSRRSAKKKGANDAIHMVSAFAAQQRLVLGQTKVDKKSNEACPREGGDRCHPKIAEHASDRGRHRHHRRDGLPAGNRQANDRQRGRLRAGA